ncbi:hypothetical protein Cfor_06562, partial [Coptotermes formosanus]
KVRQTTATATKITDAEGNAKGEEDVSRYELQIFRLNFLLLQCIGLWISDSASRCAKILYSCFTVFVLSVLTLNFTTQIAALFHYRANLRIITYTLASLTGTVITSCDYVNFLCRKRTVLNMVEEMQTGFIAKVRPKYRKYLDKTESQAKIFTLLRCLLAVFAVITAGIMPLILTAKATKVEGGTTNTTIEDIIAEKMIIGMYTPFDIRRSPQFEAVYAYQVLAGTMMVIASQSVDLMLMVLMSLVAARFTILGKQLNDMAENVAMNETNYEKNKLHEDCSTLDGTCEEKGAEGPNEEVFRQYLVECIKEHQAAIEFAYRLNDVIGIAGLIDMITIPIMLCSTGYLMMHGVNVTNYFKFLTLFLLVMYKLLVYCWYGQDVINQSEEVQTALYGTDWYRLSPAFKRLVPLMLMRASKAVKLRNGIFNDLCFATFSGVRLFLLQDLGTVLKLGTGTVPYKHKGSSSAAGGNKYWARFAVPKGQGCQHSALAIGVK